MRDKLSVCPRCLDLGTVYKRRHTGERVAVPCPNCRGKAGIPLAATNIERVEAVMGTAEEVEQSLNRPVQVSDEELVPEKKP